MTDKIKSIPVGLQKQQNYIDSRLNKGIAFSLFWAAGIGSFIALRNGLECLALIKQSNSSLSGKGKAYWCIIFGTIGLIIWIPIIIIVLLG